MSDLTPDELEQLARSIAMRGNLGDRNGPDVIDALRRLAAIETAQTAEPHDHPPKGSATT